jgi:hypothetical protein
MPVALEKRVAAHHHPRSAEPALQGVVRDECRLDRSELLAPGQAFDRRDRPPDRVEGENRAGRNRLVAEHHSARPAGPAVAANLGAGEPQLVAQHSGERLARLHRQAAAFAVHLQLDLDRRGTELLGLSARGAGRRRQERRGAGQDAGSLDEPAPGDLQLVLRHRNLQRMNLFRKTVNLFRGTRNEFTTSPQSS